MRSRTSLASAGALCALGATLLLASPLGAAGPRAAHPGDVTTYADPSGDSGDAPDITALTASNDADGTLHFGVVLANRQALGPNDAVMVALRDPDGTAHSLVQDAAGDAAVCSYSSTESKCSSDVGSLRVGYADGVASFVVAAADVGVATSVQLAAAAVEVDGTGQNVVAEDTTDQYDYVLAQPAAPKIAAAHATPRTAKAGKRLTVSFAVASGDDGSPLADGTMVCDPRVGGKVLAHSESFRQGVAKLSFVVPKQAKGKLLRVTVTIEIGAESTTRVATFRVH